MSGKAPEIVGSPGLDCRDTGDPEGEVSTSGEVWTSNGSPEDVDRKMGKAGPCRGGFGNGLDLVQRDFGDVALLGSTTGKL